MLVDPQKAMLISLFFALGPMVWFAALALDADGAAAAVGGAAAPVTFLSIFVFLAAVITALVFRRLASIKAELLAGRRVIARWRVSRKGFDRFSSRARVRDTIEKRQALFVVLGFLFVIFGGFALYDRDAAPMMSGFAVVIAISIFLAYLLGQRAMAEHLKFRTGEMIVGERGLLCDGVLHAWDIPLSRLADASLGRDSLEVTYAYYARSGTQYATALLPVSADAPEAATMALDGLRKMIDAK
jgi:hypothetical protein